MDSREFIGNVRQALGRSDDDTVDLTTSSHIDLSADEVGARKDSVKKTMIENALPLFNQMQTSAEQAGWRVIRLHSIEQAKIYVSQVVQEMEAISVLQSKHSLVQDLGLTLDLQAINVSINTMAMSEGSTRESLRDMAINADIGVTGVDYAIAETGTCVIIPDEGVSRTISLLPPVHIAVLKLGDVVPSLDELFTLRRDAFLNGELGTYMNLISGPSRTADIEYTIVTGVHGPGEVHLVMLDNEI